MLRLAMLLNDKQKRDRTKRREHRDEISPMPKRPALQLRQSVAPPSEYRPATQSLHDEAAAAENLPARHGPEQEDEPDGPAPKRPAAQSMQPVAAPSE